MVRKIFAILIYLRLVKTNPSWIIDFSLDNTRTGGIRVSICRPYGTLVAKGSTNKSLEENLNKNHTLKTHISPSRCRPLESLMLIQKLKGLNRHLLRVTGVWYFTICRGSCYEGICHGDGELLWREVDQTLTRLL